MGEALMFRAGAGGNGSSGGNYELVTHVIETNQKFTMPEGVQNNQIYVRIFGGGGGGAKISSNKAPGGGGGWMNNGWVTLGAGSQIDITIGRGGNIANAGGTTFFGSYLSANGGGAGNSFSGGYGGSGGGAGGLETSGGIGYQFGGGGSFDFVDEEYGGIGGQWGGNGEGFYGEEPPKAENGINTIALISETDLINSDAIGYAIAGTTYSRNGSTCVAGGGGYGANGGSAYDNCWTSSGCRIAGGGGGYGPAGNGGCVNQMSYATGTYKSYGGGGGAYRNGGSSTNGGKGDGIGGGAGGAGNSNGGNGICLIWYYKKT